MTELLKELVADGEDGQVTRQAGLEAMGILTNCCDSDQGIETALSAHSVGPVIDLGKKAVKKGDIDTMRQCSAFLG